MRWSSSCSFTTSVVFRRKKTSLLPVSIAPARPVTRLAMAVGQRRVQPSAFLAMFQLGRANGNAAHDERSDIMMSIKPEHIANIACGLKNHEYRKYNLPESVMRIWFYTTESVRSIEYVALIGRGRKPGEVPDDGGIGNADFNAGKKQSKFGFPILKLWKLSKPVGLDQAKRCGYLRAAPQKYNYAGAKFLNDYPIKNLELLIDRTFDNDYQSCLKEGHKRGKRAREDGTESVKKQMSEKRGRFEENRHEGVIH